MFNFVETTEYRLLVCCVIMPMNGFIMTNNFIVGALLVVAQVPYLLKQFKTEE